MKNNIFTEQILADFEAFEQKLNGQAVQPLHHLRKEAYTSLQALDFPTTKHEEWKYSSVKEVLANNFHFNKITDFSKTELNALDIPNLSGNVLYFINGVYKPEISQIVSDIEEIKICSILEAQQQYPEVFNAYFNKNTDQTVNAFTALNTAFVQNGLFIYVPAGHKLEQPLIIRYINDARTTKVAAQPRNLVVVEQGAEIQFAESFRGIGANASFTNTYTEIFVAETANVHYYKVQDDTDANYHIGTTAVWQKDKSVFTANTITIGGGFVRNNLNIKVDGEYAVANMFGLYIPNGSQHIDNHTIVDHMLPNSESNEFYKGILKDKSTGVFNGKIFVREDAQKTNAFQSCKNVLASTEATMNTKPQLEIWADDVKCSHGTTTGQLNDEALFYMQSRGISKPTAKSLLMLAFAQDVIDKMEIIPIKEYLQGLVQEKLYNG